MEPGVSLCFRGFRGGRRKAGHCGQCADARFVWGNEVKERAPQLCVEGLSAWGAHQAWAVSANSSQPSRLSPQAALVRLHSQDGKTTLQFLRVKLTSSLVCTHVHTCPARCQHRRFHSVPLPPLHFTATSLVCVRIFPA